MGKRVGRSGLHGAGASAVLAILDGFAAILLATGSLLGTAAGGG